MANAIKVKKEILSSPINLIFDKNKVGGVYPLYKYCGRGMYDDLKRFILENEKSRDKKMMFNVDLAKLLLHLYRDFENADPLPHKEK